MDLMGPLQEPEAGAGGNKHVLVVADPFTKWVEVFPVPNMEAEKVVAWQIICHFGTLRVLHSDQGRTFQSKVMAGVARV